VIDPLTSGFFEHASDSILDQILEAFGLPRKPGESDDEYRERARVHFRVPGDRLAEMHDDVRAQRDDALLQADDWRNTAARWRKRFLRGCSAWKTRAIELEADVGKLNEEADDLRKQIRVLKDAAAEEYRKEVISGRQREKDELERKLKDAEERAAIAGRLSDQSFRRIAELTIKLQESERQRAHAMGKAAEERQAFERKHLDAARARIRVLASRLGISVHVPGYDQDDWLTDRLDRVLYMVETRLGSDTLATIVAKALE
jgi:hypothetical protein